MFAVQAACMKTRRCQQMSAQRSGVVSLSVTWENDPTSCFVPLIPQRTWMRLFRSTPEGVATALLVSHVAKSLFVADSYSIRLLLTDAISIPPKSRKSLKSW